MLASFVWLATAIGFQLQERVTAIVCLCVWSEQTGDGDQGQRRERLAPGWRVTHTHTRIHTKVRVWVAHISQRFDTNRRKRQVKFTLLVKSKDVSTNWPFLSSSPTDRSFNHPIISPWLARMRSCRWVAKYPQTTFLSTQSSPLANLVPRERKITVITSLWLRVPCSRWYDLTSASRQTPAHTCSSILILTVQTSNTIGGIEIKKTNDSYIKPRGQEKGAYVHLCEGRSKWFLFLEHVGEGDRQNVQCGHYLRQWGPIWRCKASTSVGLSSEFVTQHIIKTTKFNKLALLYINSSNYKYPSIRHKIAVLLLYCNNVPCVHRKSHHGFFFSVHFQLDKKLYISMTELFAGISDVCFDFTAADMTEMTVPARLTGEAVAVNND